MKSTNDAEAYRRLFEHIAVMRNDVEHLRNVNNGYLSKRAKRKSYPAVTTAAEYDGLVGVGDQHHYSSEIDFHKEVYDKLIENFQKLNIHTNYDPNNLSGHCAENYAASKVLDQLNPQGATGIALSDISFADSIQPRTGRGKEWCGNCHKMFD